MTSRLETILITLFSALELINTKIERNAGIPATIGPNGLIIMHDGEPGQPEVMLSPLTYHYEHTVELDIYAEAATPDDADMLFDNLRTAIGQAINQGDRRLGGLCDWIEAQAARPTNLPLPGTLSIKAATIPVVIHFATSNPLA
jgi:hypothetical protein